MFRLLDRARERPVLWVTGPPGAGKTTLVASYVEARRLRHLWYQVEGGDADLAAFFYNMGLAVAHDAPRARQAMPLLGPEYQGDLATFARAYFRDLFRRLGPPFALVFDDYQAIADDAPLHAALREAVAELPRGGRLIVLSRALPPPAFVRARARQMVATIGWDALRFSLGEWRRAARLGRAHRLGSSTLRDLHGRMRGWIAGLVLAAEGADGETEEEQGGRALRFESEQAMETVFDYFAEEVLSELDGPRQAVLLQTAVLPRMTSAMAARLTGFEGAGRLLAELSRRNYFIQRQAGPEPVYRYHPLFRDFLLAQARRRLAPAKLQGVHQRAATLLARNGEVEAAVSLFREAGDAEGLGRLLLEHAPALASQGRFAQLDEWLSSLPPPLAEETPWLRYWRGVCHLPFRPEDSQVPFESAFRGFDEGGDVPGLFLAWSGVVDSILYHWGDCTQLDHWIAGLDELMRRHPEFPSQDIELRVATSMAAALLFRQPRHAALRAWAERAVRCALAGGSASQRMLTAYYAVCHRFWMGDQAGAATLLEPLRRDGEAADTLPLARIMWHTLEAIRLWHEAATDACLETVARGLAIAETSGVRIWDFQLAAQGVFAGLTAADLGTARRFLDRMASVLRTARRLDVSLYHYLAGWEAILAGDVPRARDHAERGLDLTIVVGTPFPEGLNRLSMAQVLHEAGQADLAAEHLRLGQAIADRLESAQLQFIASATGAYFALARGDDASALAALRQMTTLGRRHGIMNTPWWRPRVMARMCQKALEAGIETDYVRDLIRRRRLVPDEPPVAVETWPWPVRVSTLGSFTVLVDDRPLVFSRKAQQKPLALLKAVVAFGGRAVAEDQLVDALWAEAEGDAAHHALTMTLHRLRRLLGLERAVVHQGGRVSLDPFTCWLDTWAVERRLEDAEIAARRGDTSAAGRDTEAALALYRGPFLDTDGRLGWTTSLRERLRSKVVRAVTRLGQQSEAEGDWERAAELYERGLAVEELAEELYRGLMSCRIHQGRRADALATYRRCRAALSAELGMAPSRLIEALHRSLLASP